MSWRVAACHFCDTLLRWKKKDDLTLIEQAGML